MKNTLVSICAMAGFALAGLDARASSLVEGSAEDGIRLEVWVR